MTKKDMQIVIEHARQEYLKRGHLIATMPDEREVKGLLTANGRCTKYFKTSKARSKIGHLEDELDRLCQI